MHPSRTTYPLFVIKTLTSAAIAMESKSCTEYSNELLNDTSLMRHMYKSTRSTPESFGQYTHFPFPAGLQTASSALVSSASQWGSFKRPA